MANGRPPDDGSSRSRKRRSKVANAGGLQALGEQIGSTSTAGGVANESGLSALGARIDERRRRPQRRPGRPGRRWWQGRPGATARPTALEHAAQGGHGGGLPSSFWPCWRSAAGTSSCSGASTRSTSSMSATRSRSENGAPFTVLVIGSDTRVGQNSQAFGSSAEVTGQRSDVVQLWRVTPSTKEIQVLSIPRDTVVSLLGANATEFGTFNRINSAFDSGTDQLVADHHGQLRYSDQPRGGDRFLRVRRCGRMRWAACTSTSTIRPKMRTPASTSRRPGASW